MSFPSARPAAAAAAASRGKPPPPHTAAAGLYSMTYASAFPPPACAARGAVNFEGKCIDFSRFGAQMRDDAQDAGACAPMHKQVNGYCIPTNTSYVTPPVGSYGMDTQVVAFGPAQASGRSCFFGGCA